MGLNHATLKTIYTGGIIPLLLYIEPVWKKPIDKVSYKSKLVSVQRLINNKITKAYRTVSNEGLCTLTELTAIAFKIEETCQFYQLTKGTSKAETLVDRDMAVRYWHHPAETVNFLIENNEETSTVQIFTDGSTSEQRVGAGVAIFRSGTHIKSLTYRLNQRCTNNQAEKLAILRAQEYTENLQTKDKTATIYTDSRMTQGTLKNSKIYIFLTEEMRRKLTEMEKTNWKVQFSSVNDHVGIQGN